MFHYEYPSFEKKHLLRIEMLERLRDYPRNYLDLLYHGCENGVICGCELTWEDGELTVMPGMLWWNGNVYFMEQSCTLVCKAHEKLRFLKVKFLEEKQELSKVVGRTDLYLDEKRPLAAEEMELCRFFLQEGARLRCVYQDFSDYSTKYDTINLIHTPYLCEKECGLRPEILMQFAKEMMTGRLEDPYDISFCMNVLANDGQVGVPLLSHYIAAQRGTKSEIKTNLNIYQELLAILKTRKVTDKKPEVPVQQRKGILLL